MIIHKEPSVLGTLDAFRWWLQVTKKEHPYLKTPNYSKIRKKMVLSKKLDVPVMSNNKDELEYLGKKVFEIDEEII